MDEKSFVSRKDQLIVGIKLHFVKVGNVGEVERFS